jgi:phosphatidylinositol alpha-1,6-mannosyltransferase
MDVFAMPARSRWFGLEVEGLGLVYLEAAASGLPVIAGRSGGAPETVDDGVTGFVVGDVDELAARLELLAADPDLRAAMGSSGRTRIEKHWTWQHVADRLVDMAQGSLHA